MEWRAKSLVAAICQQPLPQRPRWPVFHSSVQPDVFFYYSNKTPSAVRYKNWKMYFGMVGQSPTSFITGVVPYGWTQVVNIKRDPFVSHSTRDAAMFWSPTVTCSRR